MVPCVTERGDVVLYGVWLGNGALVWFGMVGYGKVWYGRVFRGQMGAYDTDNGSGWLALRMWPKKLACLPLL